jgi:hypothetical protein
VVVGVLTVAAVVGWIKYDMERNATPASLAPSSGLNLQFAPGSKPTR